MLPGASRPITSDFEGADLGLRGRHLEGIGAAQLGHFRLRRLAQQQVLLGLDPRQDVVLADLEDGEREGVLGGLERGVVLRPQLGLFGDLAVDLFFEVAELGLLLERQIELRLTIEFDQRVACRDATAVGDQACDHQRGDVLAQDPRHDYRDGALRLDRAVEAQHVRHVAPLHLDRGGSNLSGGCRSRVGVRLDAPRQASEAEDP